ncbi:ABC transporter permease [Halomicrobium salinisoli]|uniref:ABC transporter permease n=1 Tax=Halomicrobium salinisoli TaxID=2878391 RepID=UPI001CEFEFE0|nr:ABC transporter permease [Halomicrobium salinisoli]
MPSDTQAELAIEPTGAASDGGWTAQARAFAERYAREMVRSKGALAWSLGFPAFFYLLTYAFFVSFDEMPAAIVPDVKAALAVGFGSFTVIAVGVTAFGQAFVTDVEDGRYLQFRSLPIAPSADLVGRLLAGLGIAVLSFGVMLLVGLASGAEFTLRGPASAALVPIALVGFAVPWLALGLAIGTAVDDTRYASIVATFAVFALYFVTGFNGAESSMFAADPVLLNYLPNTLPARFLTYHLVGIEQWGQSSTTPPAMPGGLRWFWIIVAYGAANFLAALAVLRRFVYDRGVLP